MFDTHCHLNFKAFENRVQEVVDDAKKAGVTHIVIPGTDIETSKKAVEIAGRFEDVYAAVGIHPHHVFELSSKVILGSESDSRIDSGRVRSSLARMTQEIKRLEELLILKKVVAVGEVGLDRHYYVNTRHENYQVNEEFIGLQKAFLTAQITLALKYDKSVILHNREAKKDMLPVLNEIWDTKLEGRTVFHCCEPDSELLEFAQDHKMFIGVDGDITYRKDKQEFIKKVPLEMLVLETDSPFLLPEPLRSQKKVPRSPSLRSGVSRRANDPKNLTLIAEFIARLTNTSTDQIIEVCSENAKKLFRLS